MAKPQALDVGVRRLEDDCRGTLHALVRMPHETVPVGGTETDAEGNSVMAGELQAQVTLRYERGLAIGMDHFGFR